MAPAHFNQDLFISCEDQLAKIAGFHNFGCAASGLAIMAQPIRAFLVAKSVLGNGAVEKTDAILYFFAQFLLFYLNLHQHATGYINPDLEVGGCLHSIFLAQWVHNNPLRDIYYQSWTLPKYLVGSLVTATVGSLLWTCWFSPEKQTALASAISGPFSLYVITTMGFRSYHLKKQQSRSRSFLLWIGACLSLIAARALVVLEQKYMCHGILLSRTFHPILIHAVIVLLFYTVSECAIEVIHGSQHAAISSSGEAYLDKRTL